MSCGEAASTAVVVEAVLGVSGPDVEAAIGLADGAGETTTAIMVVGAVLGPGVSGVKADVGLASAVGETTTAMTVVGAVLAVSKVAMEEADALPAWVVVGPPLEAMPEDRSREVFAGSVVAHPQADINAPYAR